MKIQRPWLENWPSITGAQATNPTIEHLWRYLLSPISFDKPWERVIEWPPDVFALCAAALRRSGGYATTGTMANRESREDMMKCGTAWAKSVAQETLYAAATPEINLLFNRWQYLCGVLNREIYLIADDQKLIETLLFLLGAADEAGRGLGVLFLSSSRKRKELADVADELLRPTQFGSSLCMSISPSVARVLPKVHTAKPGLTIRSFSHYLSYCETDEVQPQWYFIPSGRGDTKKTFHLNLLVVPWPPKTRPEQIKAKNRNRKEAQRDSSPWGYFEYQPFDSGRDVARVVSNLCDEALRTTGSVDAVIMPELALGIEDYQAVRDAVLQKGLLLVTGVGSKEPSGQDENRLCIDVPLSPYHYVHLRQRKHHRWRLDRSQIEQYGLAASLDRSKWYWEDIEVRDRKLMFLVLRPWLVACAVICEDLARHDPVGDLIRGVGPNLVVALLMDGPQIASRWSSRYASSLADDPGSSVLSVTSLGMSQLSGTSNGDSRSRVIALWRDSKTGTREIELPEGNDAVLLTLCSEPDQERSADDRTRGGAIDEPDFHGAYTTILSGWHPIKTAPSQEELAQKEGRVSPVPIGAREASVLAQLAQQKFSPDHAPENLKELEGDAFLIGQALWEAMVSWQEKMSSLSYQKFSELFVHEEESDVRRTALAIQEWAHSNWDAPLPLNK